MSISSMIINFKVDAYMACFFRTTRRIYRLICSLYSDKKGKQYFRGEHKGY